jgi:hypothetical protein
MAADNLQHSRSSIDAIPMLATPEVSTKAREQLEGLQKAVQHTSAVGGRLWLSYLFVLFYLAIAAGGVSPADLLVRNPVKLPFLNIDLPLFAFFFLAPYYC